MVQVQSLVETCQEIRYAMWSTIMANRNIYCSKAKVSATFPLVYYDMEILTVWMVQKGRQEFDYFPIGVYT